MGLARRLVLDGLLANFFTNCIKDYTIPSCSSSPLKILALKLECRLNKAVCKKNSFHCDSLYVDLAKVFTPI